MLGISHTAKQLTAIIVGGVAGIMCLGGLLLLLQPALSFVFDVILFARPTRALDWIGVALSLVGIFVGSYRRSPRPVAEPAVTKP